VSENLTFNRFVGRYDKFIGRETIRTCWIDMSLIYTDLLYRDLTKMTYLWEM